MGAPRSRSVHALVGDGLEEGDVLEEGDRLEDLEDPRGGLGTTAPGGTPYSLQGA